MLDCNASLCLTADLVEACAKGQRRDPVVGKPLGEQHAGNFRQHSVHRLHGLVQSTLLTVGPVFVDDIRGPPTARALQLKRSFRHAYLALSVQIECARRITRLRLSAGDQLTGHHACGQCPFPHLIVSREVNMSGLSAFPVPSHVFACLSVEQGAEGNRPTDGRIKAARRGPVGREKSEDRSSTLREA
jgi:hypothetical protein